VADKTYNLQTWDGEQFNTVRTEESNIPALSWLQAQARFMPNCPARVTVTEVLQEYEPTKRKIR